MTDSWVLIDDEEHSLDDKYKTVCDKSRKDLLEKYVDVPNAFMPGGECFGKTVAANTRDGCANKLRRQTMILKSSDNEIIAVIGEDTTGYRRKKSVQTADLEKPKYYINVSKDKCEKLKTDLHTSKFLRNWDAKKHKTLPKKSPVTAKEIDKVKKCVEDYKNKVKKYDEAKKKLAIDFSDIERHIGDWPFNIKQLKKGIKIPSILKKTTLEKLSKKDHITSIGKFEEERKKAKFNYDDITGVYAHPEYPLNIFIKIKDGRIFSVESQKRDYSYYGAPDCGASKLHDKSKKAGDKMLEDLQKKINFKTFDVTKIKGVEKEESYRDPEMIFDKKFRRAE